ncbi:hypothetical protein [Plantibacter flavus]|uniref:hypothetical protein n=1 Tax=Plantibacter flavus TaxID=150123 RepID=UPI00129482FB|nr:hypothetical protein [Plantibacter flavus]
MEQGLAFSTRKEQDMPLAGVRIKNITLLGFGCSSESALPKILISICSVGGLNLSIKMKNEFSYASVWSALEQIGSWAESCFGLSYSIEEEFDSLILEMVPNCGAWDVRAGVLWAVGDDLASLYVEEFQSEWSGATLKETAGRVLAVFLFLAQYGLYVRRTSFWGLTRSQIPRDDSEALMLTQSHQGTFLVKPFPSEAQSGDDLVVSLLGNLEPGLRTAVECQVDYVRSWVLVSSTS